ncbi:carbohydrate ABC transporter permease [Pengzhenrongella frigida]|uniref:Carbohydrate ABC transporter permease n=1 Tax=Pengzhenrongella frigida TaxID=1259133 RepID=A0A4Q5MWT8_9MICO|nr:carbohydrate ABC transporter permease [Cellulomonas sp. HLT2-17]RYV50060.1 carbohydrate ABC transporter permease [Cellulomonas sp. HLT2-17]
MSAPTLTREPGARRRGVTQRRNLGSHTFLVLLVLYFALPLWWLIVASTKNINGLFTGTGGPLWFDSEFDLVANVRQLFSQNGGIYWRWLGNSFLYAIVGGVGATVLSVLAGYGFAKYRFRGRNLYFAVLLGSVMVPLTALVIPTFVLLSDMGLTNTIWAVILPSLLSPFGVYLMRVYAQDAVPDELLDAARVDGAGDFKTFVSVALPLLRPAIVTVLLLSTVATWNNYFLPLAVLSDTKLLPVTVGLGQWQAQSTSGAAGSQLWNLVITGALISIIPLVVSFLSLQKYWQGGLSLGSLK